MKKIYSYICLALSIICIITALKFVIKNQTIVYVTPKNENILKDYLEDAKIENINEVTKIGIGDGVTTGALCIYYSSGKTYDTIITSGAFEFSNLEKYVRENGYNLSTLSPSLTIFSAIFFIIFLITIRKPI